VLRFLRLKDSETFAFRELKRRRIWARLDFGGVAEGIGEVCRDGICRVVCEFSEGVGRLMRGRP
jgi:hypothetical protein